MTFTDPRSDETFTFPIRLSPDLNRVAKELGLADIACYSQLWCIDDVEDLLEALHGHVHTATGQPIGEGEELEDDLYRLCVRIRDAWQAQQKY